MPNYSLTTRGHELGGAPRWVDYLVKVATGFVALTIITGLLSLLGTPTERRAWVAFVCLLAWHLTTKVTPYLAQAPGWRPLNWRDWCCDTALTLSPVTVVLLAVHAPEHAGLYLGLCVLLFGFTYPYSSE